VFPAVIPREAKARSSTSLLDLTDFIEALDPLNPPVNKYYFYDDIDAMFRYLSEKCP
jgi:hypothetical protein